MWFAFLGLVAGDPALAEQAAARYHEWLQLIEDRLVENDVTTKAAPAIARRMIAFLDGLTLQTLMDPAALPTQRVEQELRRFMVDPLETR